MRKATQKEIRNLINYGAAIDITSASFDDVEKLRRKADFEVLAISSGVYGMNGAIFKDRKSGKLYAIKSRSGALFQLV